MHSSSVENQSPDFVLVLYPSYKVQHNTSAAMLGYVCLYSKCNSNQFSLSKFRFTSQQALLFDIPSQFFPYFRTFFSSSESVRHFNTYRDNLANTLYLDNIPRLGNRECKISITQQIFLMHCVISSSIQGLKRSFQFPVCCSV